MQKPVNLSQLDSPERNISRIVSEDHSEQVQKSTQHDNTQKEKAQERTVSSPFRLSIKPRRKRNSGKLVSPSCVVVSAEVVESLRELALPDAARSIGISVTAFKAACRRLGIRRWNHTRGRSRKQNNDVGIGEERVSSPIDYSHPPAPRPALNVTGEAGRLAAWHDSELSSTESWLYSSDSDEENLTLVAHQISGSTDTGQSLLREWGLQDLRSESDAEALELFLQNAEEEADQGADHWLVHWLLAQPWPRAG